MVVDNYTFQQVEIFKYHRMEINKQNNIQNEIKLRMSVAYDG